MYWIIGSVIISAIIAAISTIASTHKTWIKRLLIVLAVAGLVIGVGSGVQQGEEKRKAEDAATQAKKELEKLNTTLALVRLVVGDLGKLNDLSGGRKYYVRIAADTVRDRLTDYLARIESQFKGAQASGLVTIRDPKPGSQNYELVFGQHLDVTAAEVFHRLAMSHKLPPKDNVAAILPE